MSATWFDEAVIYQIYPIGFCGAPHENAPIEDDAIAEAPSSPSPAAPIRKVAAWAPYLERMGFSAVLLNPVFESDSHGYDTRDLCVVDRRLGANADFADACRELHAHGVRVILDAVFNHVGRGFWAFRDVRARKWDSPYRDWFNISFEGDSPYGDGFWYEGWEGHYELVKLNLSNPAVVDHLLDCVRGWIEDFGIDGLRLDVAYSLDHGFMCRLHEFTRSLKPDFALVGETLHGDYNQLVNDQMLDSCTNYECYKGLYSSFNSQNMFEIAHSLHRQFGGDPWCIYQGKHLLSFADNHDVTRLASILTDAACIRPAYGVLFGMPGVPCVYYGSEWGAEGVKGAGDDWDLRPSFAEPVENALAAFVRRLVGLRRGTAGEAAARALAYGGYRNVVITNKQLLFERACEGAALYVAVNAVAEPFRLQSGELNGTFTNLLVDSGEDSVAGERSVDGAAGELAGAPIVELDGSLELAPYDVRFLLRA